MNPTPLQSHARSRSAALCTRSPLARIGLPSLLFFVMVALLTIGCEPAVSDHAPSVAGDVRPQPIHVDSTFPIQEEIRRFREGMPEPAGLEGGAATADELVETFIRRLEAGDTLGVAALALGPAEFGWLYYPHTIYVERPYELPPSLVWFQLQNRSSRGMARLLRAYAGRSLHYTGYQCPDEGESFGPGRIWNGCTVRGRLPSGETVEERLFGSVLAVDGRYKFVSFANEL